MKKSLGTTVLYVNSLQVLWKEWCIIIQEMYKRLHTVVFTRIYGDFAIFVS